MKFLTQWKDFCTLAKAIAPRKWPGFTRLTCMVVSIFLLSSQTLLAEAGNAQKLETTKVTIGLEGESLKAGLKQIEAQTSFRFAFVESQISGYDRIILPKAKRSVLNTLELLLNNTHLKYIVKDNTIVLLEEKINTTAVSQEMTAADFIEFYHAAYKKPTTITGTVTDESGKPLSNVSVQEKNTNNGTVTDEQGEYTIHVADNKSILVFSHVAYTLEEQPVNDKTTINVRLKTAASTLQDVVVVGYGTKKKEAITGAISTVTSKDIENAHGGSTVSTALAGKIPGVSFRQVDGRPGSGASVQIRNYGTPLYVIDGIQQDEGQFNNIAPTDIESITVLKDASAAIYGVRAANGVVVVTTKRGKLGTRNSVNLDAYTGWQNWTRFPKGTNAYEWQLGKVEADVNEGRTPMAKEELEKWKAGTEDGYKSFDWYDFIVKKNAPLTNLGLSFTGGSDKINYYTSITHLKQYSVLGREFTFERTNIQSNIDARITNSFKIGAQINGRVETRDQPGVPGGDDYWEARFAILKLRPTERPYANDNPDYIADLGNHANENWAYQKKSVSGYWREDWRVLQGNLTAEWKTPIKGLSVNGLFSYFYADKVMNGHEYTLDFYTYDKSNDQYIRTGGSTNPWRERGTHKNLSPTIQLQASYNRTFGKHSIAATFVNERIKRRELDTWVHAVPTTNVLPLIYFNTMDTYNDADDWSARIGYIGRVSYNYANKYYVELAARRDGSWKFSPDHRWGNFPSVSAGWRLTQEDFFMKWANTISLNELKLRGSWGRLGDDDNGVGPYDWRYGYNYNVSTNILDSYNPSTGGLIRNNNTIIGSRDKGVPITNISWYISEISNVGLDYAFLNNKVTGSLEFFKRKRTGLRGRKYDVLMPSELGYSLPDENINSDANVGGEFAINYNGSVGRDFVFRVGGNVSISRRKIEYQYKPVFDNSLDHYRNGSAYRWDNLFWGYTAIGQFKSQDEISQYAVDIDGKGNTTLLPGDLKYKDENGDGVINDYDMRPIGWGTGKNPILYYGFNLGAAYKGFDFTAQFSGGGMSSYNVNWEIRAPFQNEGALNKEIFDGRSYRVDPYDPKSAWVIGKYPAMRYNPSSSRQHSDYNINSTFWLKNVHYLRLRTIEIGYNLPANLINKVKLQKARFYANAYNLLSLDNLRKYGVDAEVNADNGLDYPQSSYFNIGVNLTF
ncbi:TonB-dependent receptor [Danxiaibacter flavus]|uniref:TonB-dependent receptor n=1 Tax=Danxiaibacter flavus TaxID=3049108 RepID=A0ABV3ZCM1_9BACT|nr:TonB-dependent receptor [Chitinophagaceae bacterium DXS]